MNYNPDQALKSYHNIRAMLKGIPRSLWDLVLPEKIHELALLESRLIKLRLREADRNKVMAIQGMCGFPLRPNAPLREMATKLRIQRLKRRGPDGKGDSGKQGTG